LKQRGELGPEQIRLIAEALAQRLPSAWPIHHGPAGSAVLSSAQQEVLVARKLELDRW